MTKPRPLTPWQEANTPPELPRSMRRNIAEGPPFGALGPCWLWTRSRSPDGYGWASYRNKTYQAHAIVYTILVGPLPKGLQRDHLCRVRHCVNPSHLDAVTCRVNLERSPLTTTGRTTCAKGHPLSRWYGQRRCLTCLEAYRANYNARKRITR